MNKRIKQLAEQADIFKDFAVTGMWFADDEELELFADLIRQDEAKSCAEHYLGIMRDAVEQAVLKERESCAKLLYDFSSTRMVPAKDTWRYGVMMAANCVRDKK